MSAREVIAGVEEYHAVSGPERIGDLLSERILSALAAAGYRLLGPDELDPVTVEKCITAARNCYLRLSQEDRAVGDILDDRVMAALRSLTGGGNV